MDMIRIQRLNLLPNLPGKGNLDFVVARAIKVGELPGINIHKLIVIQNSTCLKVRERGNNAIDLILQVICNYENFFQSRSP